MWKRFETRWKRGDGGAGVVGAGVRELGPQTGEGLDAYTWVSPDAMLTVGTEDGDVLRQRAERQQRMPRRISSELGFDVVAYPDEGGMATRLPDLRAGDAVQLPFVISWECGADETSLAPWFAVDFWARELAEALGISGAGYQWTTQ